MNKLLKKSYLSFIFLLFCGFSFSQQYLNKTFLVNGVSYTPTTIIPTDSGYLCSSFSAINIYLLDSSANLKWHKQYNLLWPAGMGTLNKTSGGKYYSAGTMQLGGLYEKPYLVKFNSVFDTLYTKVFITDSTATRTPLIVNSFRNSDGDFVLMGSDEQDSSGNVFSGNFGNGLLLMVDSMGIIKNHKTIGSNTDSDWLNTGIQIGNNYYLFGGTYSYAPLSVTGMDRMDGWVVKTDLTGNVITSASFGNPNLYDQEFKYFIKISGNKILTGHFFSYAKNTEGFLMVKPWILILDSNLLINKEIYFKDALVSGDTLFSMGNTQAINKNDSSINILGVKSAYNMNLHEVLWVKPMITKMDKNFRVNFSRDYIHNASSFFNINPQTITTTSDGGYIIGGYITDYSLTPSIQSWIVKTDSLGCDGYTSCNDTALICQIFQAPDTACKNDTTWLRVKFKGRSAPYFVFANNTLALDSVFYPYTLPLWIDTIVPYIPTITGMQQVIIKVNDPWGWYQCDTVQIFVKDCGAGNIDEKWYPKKIEIYPNPATSELHIKIRTSITTPITITIFDIQGKTIKIMSLKQSLSVIDVSDLTQGIYEIKIVSDNLNFNKRFVKL